MTKSRKTTLPAIDIDPEFSELIHAMSPDELALLEENLVTDGCRDHLVVWDRGESLILLDGHHRHEICKRRIVDFQIKSMTFEDRNAARNWIINQQLGRRNISDANRTYLLGKLYVQRKPEQGRPARNGRPDGDKPDTMSGLSAEAIAHQHGVNERTVRRAAGYATSVDAIGEEDVDLKRAILAGKVDASASDLDSLAKAPKQTIKTVARKVAQGQKKAIKAAVSKPVPPKPMVDPNGIGHASAGGQ